MKVEAGARNHVTAQDSDFIWAAPTLKQQEKMRQPLSAALDHTAASFLLWSVSTLGLGYQILMLFHASLFLISLLAPSGQELCSSYIPRVQHSLAQSWYSIQFTCKLPSPFLFWGQFMTL